MLIVFGCGRIMLLFVFVCCLMAVVDYLVFVGWLCVIVMFVPCCSLSVLVCCLSLLVAVCCVLCVVDWCCLLIGVVCRLLVVCVW